MSFFGLGCFLPGGRLALGSDLTLSRHPGFGGRQLLFDLHLALVHDLHNELFGIVEHGQDRKSTRLNSSHVSISYAVFCLKKKKHKKINLTTYKLKLPTY